MKRTRLGKILIESTSLLLLRATRCFIRLLLILNSFLEKIVSYERKRYRMSVHMNLDMDTAAKLIRAATIKKVAIGDIIEEIT